MARTTGGVVTTERNGDHVSESTTPMKRCPKCGRSLPATDEFFARRGDTGRARSDCRECRLAYFSAYNAKHREERAVQSAAYRATHREELAAYYAAYYAAHRKKKAADNAAYRAANHKRLRAKEAAYYASHRAERAAHDVVYSAAYRAAHRKERRAYNAAYYAEHREEYRTQLNNYRARKRAAEGTHTAADVCAQYERQKGRCYWCGEKVGSRYDIDHVIPLSRGGANDRSNLVIACTFCNRSKGAKMPHEWTDRLC